MSIFLEQKKNLNLNIGARDFQKSCIIKFNRVFKPHIYNLFFVTLARFSFYSTLYNDHPYALIDRLHLKE